MKLAKIVIVGKDEAGKSTLVQNIIPGALNIERQGRTIALDYGNKVHGNYKLHLFGTPGQSRFRIVRDVVARGMDLAVWVLDYSRQFDDRDHEILHFLTGLDVSFIVFANIKPGVQKERRQVTRLVGDPPQLKEIIIGSAKSGFRVTELLDAIVEVLNSDGVKDSNQKTITKETKASG
ncbi:GTP-binding protein [candidate division WOR-3 bacterium]|uniref:GTP-binding protein n=1 Tax=candidate division WOR-3 bacterium TaxID=2052148 RepID=A0A9D5K8C7_UNCW3|nr:GTP-binding protein [candidate division WOR-3 bacterium]MBD3364157.1 GTP-binding protein [candidate division WOR-3 bacterium]